MIMIRIGRVQNNGAVVVGLICRLTNYVMRHGKYK